MESEKVKEIKEKLSKEQIIEILKKRIENINPWETHALEYHKGLLDLINELETENKDYYDRLNNLQTYIDNHEEIWKGNTNNALNKFAERLKEQIKAKVDYYNDDVFDYSYNGITEKEIDETLKEFL